MTDNPSGEAAVYSIPSSLPAPVRVQTASFPVVAALLGLVAAVGLGIALFAASRLVYIYLLYNSVIGIGIGMAIAHGVRGARYRNAPTLMVIALLCSLLAYLTFNVCMFENVMRKFPGVPLGLLDFIKLRAEKEAFIGDVKLGAIGNGIVWALEVAITWYFAWSRVSSAVRLATVEAVPSEVRTFILHLLGKGSSVQDVRRELGARGWTRPADQDKALAAVGTIISAVRELNAEKGKS